MFDPRVAEITSIEWQGEDNVTINTTDGCFAGAKRKDFWNPDENWEAILIPGASIRFWSVQWSVILGFEVWEGFGWRAVWCKANNFDYKAKRDADRKGYGDFIEAEGKVIAGLIDEGCTLEDIDKRISKDHSGNTYGCALAIGIRTAKNRDLADIVRKMHNQKYGVKDGDGVVNPAVLTIKE